MESSSIKVSKKIADILNDLEKLCSMFSELSLSSVDIQNLVSIEDAVVELRLKAQEK